MYSAASSPPAPGMLDPIARRGGGPAVVWTLWSVVVLGLWLMVAPFILGYSGVSRLNDLAVGAALAILGFVLLNSRRNLPNR